jgi:hypothetical protein
MPSRTGVGPRRSRPSGAGRFRTSAMQQPVFFRHDPSLLGELTLAADQRSLACREIGLARIKARLAPRDGLQASSDVVS